MYLPEQESAQMQGAGFQWDPSHQGYARWTHTSTGVTALRQPYMSDEQWVQHRRERIAEALKDMPLFLVSCVAKKGATACKAKDLYQSEWFLRARAYVERNQGRWFILSAKYGLVHPDTFIKPYEETLNTFSKAQRLDWAHKVIAQMKHETLQVHELHVLAGHRYREFLMPYLQTCGATITVPLQGLRIGEQLRKLGPR